MEITRRTMLRSLVGVGGVGLAGCFGGPSGETPTEAQPETDPSIETSPLGSNPTTEGPMSTPTPTGTSTSTLIPADECDDTGEPLCAEPEYLLQFEDGQLDLSPGTTTITATVYNPYLFEVVNVAVTLEPPSDDWTITSVRGTSFDIVPSKTEREAEWEITIPAGAIGEYELTATTRYVAGRYLAEVTNTHQLTVHGE